MPANRNALIRYTTIDQCLRNRYRKWTLTDLIDACSDALYEFEGNTKGVSERTVQLDIQTMRSEKLGYNAPIKVIEKKYYIYEDPDYSITNLPLTHNDISSLKEAINTLKQFQGFNHFQDMTGLVHKLENKVQIESNEERPVIHLDKNDNLKGLNHLNGLYQAVQNKITLNIEYRSFKAEESSSFNFFAYLLKEFNNRWFIVGRRADEEQPITLALDRIISFTDKEGISFQDIDNFHPDQYYKNIIGVTVKAGEEPILITLKVDKNNSPYIITKPIHSSQQVIEQTTGGIIITINIVPNFELERLILGYGSGMEVLKPLSFRNRIAELVLNAAGKYK